MSLHCSVKLQDPPNKTMRCMLHAALLMVLLLMCVAARSSAAEAEVDTDEAGRETARGRPLRPQPKRSMRFPRSKNADGSWRDDDESPPLGVEHEGFEERRNKRAEDRKQRHAARKAQFEDRHKRSTERREKMREQRMRDREARQNNREA